MIFSILLSIILTSGGAQGPSSDFNDSTAVNQSVAAATQTVASTNPIKHGEKA